VITVGPYSASGADVQRSRETRAADDVNSRDYSSFTTAVTAANTSMSTLVVRDLTPITSLVNITAPVRIEGDGAFQILSGGTLSLTGPLVAPMKKIFHLGGGAVSPPTGLTAMQGSTAGTLKPYFGQYNLVQVYRYRVTSTNAVGETLPSQEITSEVYNPPFVGSAGPSADGVTGTLLPSTSYHHAVATLGPWGESLAIPYAGTFAGSTNSAGAKRIGVYFDNNSGVAPLPSGATGFRVYRRLATGSYDGTYFDVPLTVTPTAGTWFYFDDVGGVSGTGKYPRSSASVTLAWNAMPNATGYKVYGRGVPFVMYAIGTNLTTWTDDGSANPAQYFPPTTDTTGGAPGALVFRAKVPDVHPEWWGENPYSPASVCSNDLEANAWYPSCFGFRYNGSTAIVANKPVQAPSVDSPMFTGVGDYLNATIASVTKTLREWLIDARTRIAALEAAISSYPQSVMPPSFTPSAGTFEVAAATMTVTLSDATAGSAIYYTTDGSTPTTGSTLYSAPFTIDRNRTVKALATKAGLADSTVATAAYDLRPAAPVFAPGSGTYSEAFQAAITSATPSVSIHYTTDGSTPTTGSTLYSAPFTVSSNQTVKAIVAKTDWTTTAVASASYTIAPLIGWASICSGGDPVGHPEYLEPTDTGANVIHVCDCQAGAQVGCQAGNDANVGGANTKDTPLRSWNAAQAAWRGLAAGGTVALCKGGSWISTGYDIGSYTSFRNTNCTAGSPCTLRDYAPTWGGTAKPAIKLANGQGAPSFWPNTDADSIGGYRILNLRFYQGSGGTELAALGTVGIRAGNRVHDVEICNCDIDGFGIGMYPGGLNVGISNPCVTTDWKVRGNRILNSCTHGLYGNCSDCDFDGNEWDNNGHATCGSTVNPPGTGAASYWPLCSNSGGTTHTVYFDGEGVCSMDNLWFRNNKVTRNAMTDAAGPCTPTTPVFTGVWYTQAASALKFIVGGENVILENNLIDAYPSHPLMGYTAISTSAQGLTDLFGGLVVRRNRLVGAGSHATIKINSTPNALIEDNIVSLTSAAADPDWEPTFHIGGENATVATVRNNTVYIAGPTVEGVAGVGILQYAGAGSVVTGNSVTFAESSPNSACYSISNPANVSYMNNNQCSGSPSFATTNNTRRTLAAWRTAYPQFDANSITPALAGLFVNAPTDLTPATSSPLIGAASVATTCTVGGVANQACTSPVAIGDAVWSPTAASKTRTGVPFDIGAMEAETSSGVTVIDYGGGRKVYFFAVQDTNTINLTGIQWPSGSGGNNLVEIIVHARGSSFVDGSGFTATLGTETFTPVLWGTVDRGWGTTMRKVVWTGDATVSGSIVLPATAEVAMASVAVLPEVYNREALGVNDGWGAPFSQTVIGTTTMTPATSPPRWWVMGLGSMKAAAGGTFNPTLTGVGTDHFESWHYDRTDDYKFFFIDKTFTTPPVSTRENVTATSSAAGIWGSSTLSVELPAP
jgi:hypothetical protein